MTDTVAIDDAELVRRYQAKLADAIREAKLLRYDLERIRNNRHHDVLCLVLKAYLEKWREQSPEALKVLAGIFGPAELVDIARQYADAAYPPPKAEP